MNRLNALCAVGLACAWLAPVGVASADHGPVHPDTPCGSPGPDAIEGDLTSAANYESDGTLDAFAFGPATCNVGDRNLSWVSNTLDHPVIAQQMYRLSTVDGASRFEQIGLSWARHMVSALVQNLCCTCNGQGGAALGVGCSDVSTASRQGVQITTVGGLGPRFEVNAHSGEFVWPYTFRNVAHVPHTSTTRRLAVRLEDIDPALNRDARYFAESQIVTRDDAAASNQDNNVSYREVAFSGPVGSQGLYAVVSANLGTTRREDPAVAAWVANDPTVILTELSTPEQANPGGDTTGRVILAADASNLGGGTWRYEYAVYNMNSDRAIASFSVPVSPNANVTNVGFHDVDYRDGDGFNSSIGNIVTFDGTDWPGAHAGDQVRWALVPADPLGNSNAIRWGTLYNFRFDCDLPPTTGRATLGLFQLVPGLPDAVTAETIVPGAGVACLRGDLNDDLLVDGADVPRFTELAVLGGGTPREICAGDLEPVPDGRIDPDDVPPFVACLLAGGCP